MKNIENMKKFYDTISEKYDFIFSLSDVQKNFLVEKKFLMLERQQEICQNF